MIDVGTLARIKRKDIERFHGDGMTFVRALHDGVTPRPGLHLVGYATPPTGLLHEIGFIARRVAAHIARQSR